MRRGEVSKIGSNSDQGRRCRHYPSPLAREEVSESCPVLLLMGKKSVEPFKEKPFTATGLLGVNSAHPATNRYWFGSPPIGNEDGKGSLWAVGQLERGAGEPER